MANNFDTVVAILKFLGLKPEVRLYKWRFIIQKTVFLAQALGMQLDYFFTIRVAGPYSAALTRDYYQHQDRIASLQTEYSLSPEDVERLEKIKKCCDIYRDQSLMEGTSTIVFLMKNNPSLSDDDVFVNVRTLKPHLTDSTCVIALTKAKELLFKPEYLTEEIKKEIAEWDRLDD